MNISVSLIGIGLLLIVAARARFATSDGERSLLDGSAPNFGSLFLDALGMAGSITPKMGRQH
jgi:hypothetical protein